MMNSVKYPTRAGRPLIEGDDMTDLDLPLHDPATYAQGFPHDYFRTLRSEGAIFHFEHPAWEDGYWAVVRHPELVRVSRESQTFRNAPHPFLESSVDDDQSGTSGLLISLDAPEHQKMRMLISKGFTPKRVADLEAKVQERVERIVTELSDRNEADLVEDLALWLPLHVIADLVGVPEADRRQVFEWTEQTFGFDPAVTAEQRFEAAMAMYGYADAMCEERKDSPRDDLMSVLLHAEVDGEQLTQMQLDLFFMLLQNAGSETTRNLITTGIVELLNEPDQYRALAEDPSKLPVAIEELLRSRHAGHAVHPHRHDRHPDRRAGDPGGRADPDGLRLCQPRCRGVRRARSARHHSAPEPARRLRCRWPPLLPRCQPGPARGPDHVRDDPLPLRGAAGRGGDERAAPGELELDRRVRDGADRVGLDSLSRATCQHRAMSSSYPYAEMYPVLRGLPTEGRSRAELLRELADMAEREDAGWESGRVSGSMYCGDRDHYAFMNEAFGLYAHMNALQRDVCPSATRFEGEIIAMGLDLMHSTAVADGDPVGLVTSGGSGSILHAMLAYREHAKQTRGIDRPNVIKPETGHPAFDKACHLLDVELRRIPVDPMTTEADVAATAAAIDENTVAVIGSACNYGYGTIDPIAELSTLAVERGIGLHVDGCLGGWILPFGEQLGFDIPPFDFRLPGVTTISADTHKYGYGFKGTSLLLFRDKALRNGQYFFMTDWSGGKYCSPGIEGSRSSGLLAATWAGIASIGRDGYLRYARQIFETSYAMQEAVRAHPQLRLLGTPTFLFAFTSDDFDVYHVNDALRARGWRMNGQQYPNAIHMCVTRPQTRPGVVDAWRADLAAAVEYAEARKGEPAKSSAIYGGLPGGVTPEADEFIRVVMADMLDSHQGLPPLA